MQSSMPWELGFYSNFYHMYVYVGKGLYIYSFLWSPCSIFLLRQPFLDTDKKEASQNTENDDLMRIIKNLSPGKKKANDGLSTKKSVSFAQDEPGQSTKDVENKEFPICKS